MLQTPYDDARGNTDRLREGLHGSVSRSNSEARPLRLGGIRKSAANRFAFSSRGSLPESTSMYVCFLLSCNRCPASWKKVNQKRSLLLPRKFSPIMAFRAVSHFATPLTGAPWISGTRTTATPAAAQRSVMAGTKSLGSATVRPRISCKAASKRALLNGWQRTSAAASSHRRSHVAISPVRPASVGDLRNAN